MASRFNKSSFSQHTFSRKKIAVPSPCRRHCFVYGKPRKNHTCKERDEETGLYYYGARYLDPKTGRWLSGDPALGDYLPSAPVDEEARKRNGSLPGQGGVYNHVNLHVYHYAGNNPVKYQDPTGMWTAKMKTSVDKNLDQGTYEAGKWDCDIYIETIIIGAFEGSKNKLESINWKPAKDTNVKTHLENMKDFLKDKPEKGTNIVFHGGNHAMLIGVNDDGTVDVTHISSTNIDKKAIKTTFESIKKFEEFWKTKGNGQLQYVPLNDSEPPKVEPKNDNKPSVEVEQNGVP